MIKKSLSKLLLLVLVGCSSDLTWTLDEANDFFKYKGNNDRNFTQGLQISASREDGSVNRRWHARQIFYTPNNKRLRDPIPTERPYAGALLAGYTKTVTEPGGKNSSSGFEFGCVGQCSGAEQTQREFHKLLGQYYPLGWSHQLHNELIFQSHYSHQQMVLGNPHLLFKRGYDVGNMFTQYWFAGRFQSEESIPIMWPRTYRSSSAFQYFGYYAEVLSRIVARNIFLDGNTDNSSRSVSKFPVVFEGRIGLRIGNFTYTLVKLSPEFVNGDAASFGEIQLTW